MDREWYRTFFHGLALDLWRAAVPPEVTAAEVELLARELRLAPGARVLDVPCGDGRHAVGLAARGCRVSGVDLSPGQIAAARARPAGAGPPVEWLLADMRALPGPAAFDAAFCFGNSFGYIDPAASEDFLRAVARALAPGGRFALQTGMVAESLLPHFAEHEEAEVGGIRFTQANRWLPDESCVETVYTFERDGQVQRQAGLQWVWTLRELRALLARAGLRPCASLGPDGGPYERGQPVVVLLAERAGGPAGA
jgi:SAM-dependent methyltransferase